SREVGTTTVVVSHDPESAAVADRVIQIRDGRVSGESTGGRTYAIVSKGWIRLPEELLRETSLDRHAALEVADRAIRVSPAGPPAPQEAPTPAESPREQPPEGGIVAETRGLTKVHGSGVRATEVFRWLSSALACGRQAPVT